MDKLSFTFQLVGFGMMFTSIFTILGPIPTEEKERENRNKRHKLLLQYGALMVGVGFLFLIWFS